MSNAVETLKQACVDAKYASEAGRAAAAIGEATLAVVAELEAKIAAAQTPAPAPAPTGGA